MQCAVIRSLLRFLLKRRREDMALVRCTLSGLFESSQDPGRAGLAKLESKPAGSSPFGGKLLITLTAALNLSSAKRFSSSTATHSTSIVPSWSSQTRTPNTHMWHETEAESPLEAAEFSSI